jgi:DNA-binding transcriptional ArsR family regulator
MPEVLSPELLEFVAERMRMLASPLRLRLLLSLAEREACVQDLADVTGAVHQKVSLHATKDSSPAAERETLVLYSLADYTAPKSDRASGGERRGATKDPTGPTARDALLTMMWGLAKHPSLEVRAAALTGRRLPWDSGGK